MPKVWCVPMHSIRGNVVQTAAKRFAIENDVVGIGWGVTEDDGSGPVPDLSADLELYLQHARKKYEGDKSLERAIKRFVHEMQEGDYCWMRIPDTGEYWCARITGGFQYRSRSDFYEHDLHVVRPAEWRKAGVAGDVPGVIVRAFSGPFGAVRRIKTDEDIALEASDGLFEPRKGTLFRDLFAAAGPDEQEDLVALYLQKRGWYIFPSTAKSSMPSYEFIMVHHDTGRRAGVQVKSGGAGLSMQAVAQDLDCFFVFTTDPSAVVPADPKIECIGRREIETFARENWHLLPRTLQKKWRGDELPRSSRNAAA